MFDLVKTSVNTCFQHSVAHASKRFVINNGKVYTQHARNVAHWVRSFSFPGSTPSCDVFFFPGRTCADNFPRSPWKKTPPHTGVDPGQLNERTHCSETVPAHNNPYYILRQFPASLSLPLMQNKCACMVM